MKTPADLIVCAPEIATCAPGFMPRPGSLMNDAGVLRDAALVVQDGLVAAVGPQAQILQEYDGEVLHHFGCVAPGLVDPHSHPLFAGSRTHEFALRARGATYAEIHAAGGGIQSTVNATRAASDETLERSARARIDLMLRHGTTTLEVKSGYGLSTSEELRHLEIYRRIQASHPCRLVATFLGAHAFPSEWLDDPDGFVDLLVDEMLPAVQQQGIAEFSDVFCEGGAFTLEQSRRVLQRSRELGLGLRIHAEEFSYLGGARMAAELGAVSVDHLQFLRPEDFPVLREAGTIPIMTAGTSFFLGMSQFAPARGLIEANLPLALGSDFNAGSCLSESLQMAMSLGVLKLGLSPAEALVAATVNSAHALRRGHLVGSLEAGKQADFLLLNLDEAAGWPYHVGSNLVSATYVGGVRRV